MKFKTHALAWSMYLVALIFLPAAGFFVISTIPEYDVNNIPSLYAKYWFASLVLIMYLVSFIVRRKAFSYTIINDKGVKNQCFLAKDIFIDWKDCTYIGIAKIQRGYGISIFAIYFSQEYLSPRQCNHIVNVRLSDKTLWAAYTPKMMDEVLKYIDKSRIIDYYLIEQAKWK